MISTHSVGLEGCQRGDTSKMVTSRDVLDRQADKRKQEQSEHGNDNVAGHTEQEEDAAAVNAPSEDNAAS